MAWPSSSLCTPATTTLSPGASPSLTRTVPPSSTSPSILTRRSDTFLAGASTIQTLGPSLPTRIAEEGRTICGSAAMVAEADMTEPSRKVAGDRSVRSWSCSCGWTSPPLVLFHARSRTCGWSDRAAASPRRARRSSVSGRLSGARRPRHRACPAVRWSRPSGRPTPPVRPRPRSPSPPRRIPPEAARSRVAPWPCRDWPVPWRRRRPPSALPVRPLRARLRCLSATPATRADAALWSPRS